MTLFDRELTLDQVIGLVECNANPDEDLVHRAALELIAALRESQKREAAQNAQRWIPVAERLPEKDTLVLLFLESGNQTKVTTGKIYTSDNPKFCGEFCIGFDTLSPDFLRRETVTHWQQLPSPPKGED